MNQPRTEAEAVATIAMITRVDDLTTAPTDTLSKATDVLGALLLQFTTRGWAEAVTAAEQALEIIADITIDRVLAD